MSVRVFIFISLKRDLLQGSKKQGRHIKMSSFASLTVNPLRHSKRKKKIVQETVKWLCGAIKPFPCLFFSFSS